MVLDLKLNERTNPGIWYVKVEEAALSTATWTVHDEKGEVVSPKRTDRMLYQISAKLAVKAHSTKCLLHHTHICTYQWNQKTELPAVSVGSLNTCGTTSPKTVFAVWPEPFVAQQQPPQRH